MLLFGLLMLTTGMILHVFFRFENIARFKRTKTHTIRFVWQNILKFNRI